MARLRCSSRRPVNLNPKPVVLAQAAVVDNTDGTYALQFAAPLPGAWELSAAVGGAPVPCPNAAAIPAEYGPLTAAECEVEGVEGSVRCGTSDPIFIQVRRKMGSGFGV